MSSITDQEYESDLDEVIYWALTANRIAVAKHLDLSDEAMENLWMAFVRRLRSRTGDNQFQLLGSYELYCQPNAGSVYDSANEETT